MATCLFHVTGPVQAYQIARTGRYVPFSVDPLNTDACLNLYAMAVRGKPVALSPDGQQVEAAGAALVVEWDGPEEVLSTWQTLPKPNVLYHQPWDQYKHTAPWRSRRPTTGVCSRPAPTATSRSWASSWTRRQWRRPGLPVICPTR